MFIKYNNMTAACTWVSLHELRQASTQVVLSLVTSHFHKKKPYCCVEAGIYFLLPDLVMSLEDCLPGISQVKQIFAESICLQGSMTFAFLGLRYLSTAVFFLYLFYCFLT